MSAATRDPLPHQEALLWQLRFPSVRSTTCG
jgi:hypothetical protein